MRTWYVASLALILGCGGDDPSGPGSTDFSGSYSGQTYAIVTSSVPIQDRDSLPIGATTLTLARSSGENYELSATGTGVFTGDVTVNSAGVMSFPNADEAEVLDNLQSVLLGVCDLANATATPQGSVVNSRLTFTALIAGAVCDWSGAGTDLRVTLIQYTWTGTR